MAVSSNCFERKVRIIMQFPKKIMTQTPLRRSQEIRRNSARGFSLIEMLVVIAVVSILMTAAAVGINGLGGKGVTSAVATSEAIFDEARATAKARSIRSCVLVARSLTNNSADDLRRIIVAYEQVDETTGEPVASPDEDPEWKISSRGTVLPEGVYFSDDLSRLDHQNSSGQIPTVSLTDAKVNYRGEYYIYQFNSEGVSRIPGASFVIGRGSRINTQPATSSPPKVTGSARRDFGGFVVWRNGGTSVFRSTDQITELFPQPGDSF